MGGQCVFVDVSLVRSVEDDLYMSNRWIRYYVRQIEKFYQPNIIYR